MMKIITRETYHKLLEIVSNIVEQDYDTMGFTEQHTIDKYLLNYEYSGNGEYMLDLLDEDGDLVFGVDGDFIEIKKDFYIEMQINFYNGHTDNDTIEDEWTELADIAGKLQGGHAHDE